MMVAAKPSGHRLHALSGGVSLRGRMGFSDTCRDSLPARVHRQPLSSRNPAEGPAGDRRALGGGAKVGPEPSQTPYEMVRPRTATASSGTNSRTAPANPGDSRRSSLAVSTPQPSEITGLERQRRHYPSARILKPWPPDCERGHWFARTCVGSGRKSLSRIIHRSSSKRRDCSIDLISSCPARFSSS